MADYGFNARNNLETVALPTGAKTVNSWQTIAGGEKTEFKRAISFAVVAGLYPHRRSPHSRRAS
ncbi:hypothetical protein AB0H92_34370 [Streptomyces phaeochromogenes]|uniref:hypothetical protein n=1 Tax=Streptomyces phaeochromogenes TaxID=1923 RepID=UPI0034114A8E